MIGRHLPSRILQNRTQLTEFEFALGSRQFAVSLGNRGADRIIRRRGRGVHDQARTPAKVTPLKFEFRLQRLL